MLRDIIVEPLGFIISIAIFFFSFFVLFSDTSAFLGSIAASLLTGMLVWISYVLLRLLYVALKK